jgi:hypothetical protein
VGAEFVPPNTREKFNKIEESKNTSAKNADTGARAGNSVSANEDEGKKSEACDLIYGGSGETGRPGGRGRAPGAMTAANVRRVKSTLRPGMRSPSEGFGVKPSRVRTTAPLRPSSGEEREIIADGEVPERPDTATRSARDTARKGEKKPGGAYSATRWYNEVFRELYEAAAGQPVLTGGREYKSAETYFRMLRELNPEMSPEELDELAGEGAAFLLGSQLVGGIFGWVSKPPDICLLASRRSRSIGTSAGCGWLPA